MLAWAGIIFSSLISLMAFAEVSSIEDLKPVERAHEAVSQIKKNFRQALEERVATKGAAQAIDACKIDAAGLTASNQGKIEVGRTSHKLRNPSNSPRLWVVPLVKKWEKWKRAEMPKNEIVELGPGHWGYVEPIFVEPICLNCHGSNLGPPVKKALKASYPNDHATGFEVGQLRGLFWLEMRLCYPSPSFFLNPVKRYSSSIGGCLRRTGLVFLLERWMPSTKIMAC